MSNPLDWLTPEGIEAHINSVWGERYGYRPPVRATEQEPTQESAQFGVSGAGDAPIQGPCRRLSIKLVQRQGSDSGEVQRLHVELESEDSSELVVKFGPAQD